MHWVREITIEDPLQENPLHLRWAAVLVLNVKGQVIKKFGGNRGWEPGRKGDRRGTRGRGGKSGGGSSESWRSESHRGNNVIVRQSNVGVIIL